MNHWLHPLPNGHLKVVSLLNLKKQLLEVETDSSFLLFGLVCTARISRLGWLLERFSGLDFEKVEDIVLPDYNPNALTSFQQLSFHDEENHLHYSLFVNKQQGVLFLNELKQFDYLLVIRGGIEFFQTTEFLSATRKISEVRLLAEIDNEKIKTKISWIV